MRFVTYGTCSAHGGAQVVKQKVVTCVWGHGKFPKKRTSFFCKSALCLARNTSTLRRNVEVTREYMIRYVMSHILLSDLNMLDECESVERMARQEISV